VNLCIPASIAETMGGVVLAAASSRAHQDRALWLN
jgi:hypothetical protein